MSLPSAPLGKPIDGNDGGRYQLHERLWDVRDRHPWDRPPKQVWMILAQGRRLEEDRSPHRLPVACPYQGKPISDLKSRHSGPCLILFNGAWPEGVDLHAVKVPLIGLNRTHVGFAGYSGPQPDYLCIVDGHVWFRRSEVLAHPAIINGSVDLRDIGYRVTKSYRMRPFSFDLARDGYVPPTTGMLAFQFAVYAGFTDLYCLGLHHKGPHFDGTDSHPGGGNMNSQRTLMLSTLPALAERSVAIHLIGSEDPALGDTRPFSEVC